MPTLPRSLGSVLLASAALVLPSACRSPTRPAPSTQASSAPSASAAATASAEPLDPQPLPDPTDPDERNALVLSEQVSYGWEDRELVKRFTDTASMRRYDALCNDKKGAACALAAFGYFDRGLFKLALERGGRGCKLGHPAACTYVFFAGTIPGDPGDHLAVFEYGPKPGASAPDVMTDLCQKGYGAGCYFAARQLKVVHEKVDDEVYALWVRSCALGHAGGCWSAAQELSVGSRKASPDKPAQARRLAGLAERACTRRPGACAELAKFFQDGIAGPMVLGSDPARMKRMLEVGCKSKDDPSYNGEGCNEAAR